MRKAKYNAEDTCPICGSHNICWGMTEHNDGYREHSATCNDCKAEWKEFYKLVFAGTDEIYDRDGNPVASLNGEE